MLKTEFGFKQYQDTLSSYLRDTIDIDKERIKVEDVAKLWQNAQRSIQHAASEVLTQPKLPLTPNRKRAREECIRAQQKIRQAPYQPQAQYTLSMAKQAKRMADENHVDNECERAR